MARYKPYTYQQQVLMAIWLEDQLLPGSFEHAVHTLVEQKMDLSIFDCRYKNDETGCTAYDPKILLKVVLFAYSRGVTGSRKIEELCAKHVTCMALACMQRPDHSTIADFVSSMKAEMLSLFCDILLVCEEQQLLGGTVFALDGLKLSSNASKEWSGTFELLQHKQEKLEAKIEALLAEHQQADCRESRSDGQQDPVNVESHDEVSQDEELPDGVSQDEEPQHEASQPEESQDAEAPSKQVIPKKSSPRTRSPKTSGKKRTRKHPKCTRQFSQQQQRARRLKRLRRQAARLKTWLATHAPKIGRQGKEIQSNITDQESAKMPTSHGVIQGYNAQAVVDDAYQVIVAAEVFGDGQDAQHLTLMVAGAKANMHGLGHGEDYFEGTTWLADSNYHSDANLKTCETEHLDAYIPDMNFRQRDPQFAKQERYKPRKKTPRKKTFTVEDFQYDAATDRYLCPTGKGLRLRAREQHLRNGVYRWYGAQEEDCRACPRRATCLAQTRTKRRNLSIPVDQASKPPTRSQQMIAKIDTVEGRKQYSRRLEIVEPVFGNIRTQKRLDHFTLRGKQKVDMQWMLYAMVHNIEKIATYGEAA
jgi:transposase